MVHRCLEERALQARRRYAERPVRPEVWMVAGAFQQAAQGLEKALTIEQRTQGGRRKTEENAHEVDKGNQ